MTDRTGRRGLERVATCLWLRIAASDTTGGQDLDAGNRRLGADQGFSLIEVIVSLAIVSLVSLAGFTLVDTLAGLQSRIGSRYDRLQDLQVILSDLTDDFAQADPASLTLDTGALTILTQVCGARKPLTLAMEDGALRRKPDDCLNGATSFFPVSDVRFTVIDSGMTEWTRWPSDDALQPRAVRIEMRMPDQPGALTGTVQGLFELPDAFAP
ncbi:PulJ/GspJ family protein [Hyphomonas oceanitis]|uniref:Type II secretion system protein J n=1 Tax=Hyphomonas oceanitis SCH89 TaxID=1280953 RepID=A0A059G5Q1_9PROT|nr:prepilin-type N-terminal cleavage/methylation domain-containing protein [Hyphomonas oceanitis]KDA01875.1 hypothetical protein HOC_13199 [Hyphomonas oceanitis SCH89]